MIDKEKIPNDVRKLSEKLHIPYKESENIDNRLFAIQTGEVVGNIYKDGIYKKEDNKPKY